MGNEKGPITWIKNKLFNNHETSADKKGGKYPYLLVVILFGIAIMLVANVLSGSTNTNGEVPVFNQKDNEEEIPAFGQQKSGENELITAYEKKYQTELKEALETIAGVGEVSVVVNVDATERKIFEKNTNTQSQTTDEIDQQGGKRTVEDLSKDEQLVIIREGEKEIPIITETRKPAIRGVLVVAGGADNVQVKKWIIEAVTRTLDVPSHQVSVLPKKSKGDS